MAPPKPQSDPFVATSGSNPKRKRDPSGTPKSDSDADESESDTEGDDEKGTLSSRTLRGARATDGMATSLRAQGWTRTRTMTTF